jgi:hypothetical protein
VTSQIEPISENAPLAPDDPALSGDEARIQNEWLRLIGNPRRQDDGFSDSADRPKIRAEEPVPSPSRRPRKVGLLLCALLLVVGAATLGVLAKEWIVLSAITNAVKSSLPAPSLAPPNEQPLEAQGPARPGASERPAPPNEQSVEAEGPASPVASETPAPPNEQPVEAQGPATPTASEIPAPSPQCNIRPCERFYRSFRASDCTYKPFRGPRRICDR